MKRCKEDAGEIGEKKSSEKCCFMVLYGENRREKIGEVIFWHYWKLGGSSLRDGAGNGKRPVRLGLVRSDHQKHFSHFFTVFPC